MLKMTMPDILKNLNIIQQRYLTIPTPETPVQVILLNLKDFSLPSTVHYKAFVY